MGNIIEEIKKKLLAQYHPKKILLFGSAALKGPDLANDLDLCIIKEGIQNKSEEFIKIRKILGRTVLPLDVLIFTREEFDRRRNIWGTVQYEIDKKGQILYDSGRD
jgi:predicted nucleotidyltransferase